MEDKIGPVDVLLQRQQILGGVEQLARLCNWKEQEIQELLEKIWESLVEIDNRAIAIAQTTGDESVARDAWFSGMSGIQYWLSLVLGVDINFMF